MTELNNIQQIKEIQNILKNHKQYLTRSFLGCCFIVFEITHRKAINQLLKNGFIKANNPHYILKGDCVIPKKPASHADVFLCRIGLDDYNTIKSEGLRESLNPNNPIPKTAGEV